MSIFKKIIKAPEELGSAIEPTRTDSTNSKEEWIWVEGYKGTDKNMCCKDFQYELNKQFDVDENEEVSLCINGFHLCLELDDVFGYYPIGESNRFFKVKALVRRSDKENYKQSYALCSPYSFYTGFGRNDKLVAKSIIFTSELTCDEILESVWDPEIPDKYKDVALKIGLQEACEQFNIDTLVDDGYSLPFATHIEKNCKFEIAHAIASQKDLSMDMKVLYILNG